MKNSFVLFLDNKEIFDALSEEQAGVLIKAIFEYETTGILVELDPVLKIAFIPIKQSLDRNRNKWEDRCEKNRENGKLGGRPPKTEPEKEEPKKANGFPINPTKAKKADSDNGSVPVSVIENDIDSEDEEDLPPPPKKKRDFSDPDLKTCIACLNDNNFIGGRTEADGIISALDVGLTAEIICYAITEAAKQNKRSWAYIDKILMRYEAEGLKTIAQIKQAEEEFASKREREAKLGTKKVNKFKNFTERDTQYADLMEEEQLWLNREPETAEEIEEEIRKLQNMLDEYGESPNFAEMAVGWRERIEELKAKSQKIAV